MQYARYNCKKNRGNKKKKERKKEIKERNKGRKKENQWYHCGTYNKVNALATVKADKNNKQKRQKAKRLIQCCSSTNSRPLVLSTIRLCRMRVTPILESVKLHSQHTKFSSDLLSSSTERKHATNKIIPITTACPYINFMPDISHSHH